MTDVWNRETDRLTIKAILRDAGLLPLSAGTDPDDGHRYGLQYHKNKEGGRFFIQLYQPPPPALRNALLDAQPPLQTTVVVKAAWAYPGTVLFMV